MPTIALLVIVFRCDEAKLDSGCFSLWANAWASNFLLLLVQ